VVEPVRSLVVEKLFVITSKDFVVQTFCSGGNGGQNQNKVASGVRIIHKESGARGESRTERSQLHNKRYAFKRLVASREFQDWLERKRYELEHKETAEEWVTRMMASKNIKAERLENDRWVLMKEDDG
jgi:protein subunit release factor B